MADEKNFDAHYLFIRTDEKYEEVRAEMHDIQIEQKEQKNNIERIDNRVNLGIAVTGNKNADDIKTHAVLIAKIQQTQELEQQKLGSLDKDVNEKLDKISKSVDALYRGILTIFFSTVVAGIIMYALKFLNR